MDAIWFGLLVIGVAALGMLAGGGSRRDAPLPFLRHHRRGAGRPLPPLRRDALEALARTASSRADRRL